ELARVVWMDEHDRPYREYAAEGLHFATTAVELRYHRSATFDDVLAITTWLEWVKRASLRMGYEIRRGDERIASGATEHAMVDLAGRPRGIPPERRARLVTRAASAAAGPRGGGRRPPRAPRRRAPAPARSPRRAPGHQRWDPSPPRIRNARSAPPSNTSFTSRCSKTSCGTRPSDWPLA